MLSLYVRIVVVAGAAAVVQSIVGLLSAPHPFEWFLFTTLVILTGSFTLNVSAINASISVADTFLIASTLLFGPAPATVALALDTFVLSWRKGYPWRRVAFNAVAPALSLWVAGHVFFLITGAAPLAANEAKIGPLIPALFLLATIYFALNSGLIAVAVGLESRRSPFKIWYDHFLWLSIGYFAAASVGLGLIVILRQVGLAAVAMMLPVVAIFHHTLRASFGRLEDARRHVTQIDRLYHSTVETLAMAIDAKDDVTHSHVRRVQAYAAALAQELKVNDDLTLKAIEAAALLHDTGKLAIPERILNKPGGLTPAEFEQMKGHVEIGANILSLVDFPYPVVPIVRCHHENWDGSGYPAGVSGTDIPIGARILSVVDCFDALTSDRPYRRAMTSEAAIAILRDRRGKMYDPDVVDAFIRIHAEVRIAEHDEPGRVEVLQQINRSLQGHPAPEPQGGVAAAGRWRGRGGAGLRQPGAHQRGQRRHRGRPRPVHEPDPKYRARRFGGVVPDQRKRRAPDGGGVVRSVGSGAAHAVDGHRRQAHRVGRVEPTGDRQFGRGARSRAARGGIDAAAGQLPERPAHRRPDARRGAHALRARPGGVQRRPGPAGADGRAARRRGAACRAGTRPVGAAPGRRAVPRISARGVDETVVAPDSLTLRRPMGYNQSAS